MVNKIQVLIILIISTVICIGCVKVPAGVNIPISTTKTNTGDIYKVKYVVDGDTFIINYQGKDTKVRMIGIDTPESVHQDKNKNTEEGKIASAYTKKRLQDQEVKLEYDVVKFDDYGRLLAYVYLDDKMYQEELLNIGYARTYTLPPNIKYSKKFINLQKQASDKKVGFWK